MTTPQSPTSELVHSYLTLRWIVGLLAITFPFVLVIWQFISCECGDIQSSISAYYHTASGDYFVGIIFAIAIFLLAYRGHRARVELNENRFLTEDYSGTFILVMLIGVALFPTGDGWQGKAHLFCAGVSFAMLAYFSLVLFVRSGAVPSDGKIRRNRIYRICGWTIVGCIALVLLFNLFFRGEKSIADLSPVFWLETVALIAFGFSWFVKGKALRIFNL